MPKIKDFIDFNVDAYFNGAVQAEWFYDDELRRKVSEVYMFHTNKYFGVTNEDIKSNNTVIDSITYLKNIVNKIYDDITSNRFILTIAGYGLGKSHFAVTLATLLSFNKENKDVLNIYENIYNIDKDSMEYIYKTIQKPNFVIVLNGMKDFNLNYEVLKVVKQTLKLHNINDDFLKELSKSYEIATYFTKNNYDYFYEKFEIYAQQSNKYKYYDKNSLKDMLLNKLENDSDAFEIVNNVYKEINGSYIRWDEGISAGEIIKKVKIELCDKRQLFEDVIIIFDEFGRYIEYASNNPTIAGESALQQIFEAVQNGDKKIMFIGFIQSDLNAYLARVNNSNIVRYLGRYETSDKYYLSSNIETIIANLIQKKDENLFKVYIENYNQEFKTKNNIIFNNINRWIKNFTNKKIWNDFNLYNNVILNGCYPFHPLTIWVLSNLNSWMQQRSSITFVNKMIQLYKNNDISYNDMPYIYPIELIESEYFEELYSAEEKGRQQSQYCINYKLLMSKFEERIDLIDKKVIQSILLINILKLNTFDISDNILAIKYMSGINDEENIKLSLHKLENVLGIIGYNEILRKYEFLVESNSIVDFKKLILKQYQTIRQKSFDELVNQDILDLLEMGNCIETAFSSIKNYYSLEWKFSQNILDIRFITKEYINYLITECRNTCWNIDESKGKVIWIYVNSDTYHLIENVSKLMRETDIKKYPIILSLIYDTENELIESIKQRTALMLLKESDKQKFEKYFMREMESLNKKIKSKFNELAIKRNIITENGIQTYSVRLTMLCNEKFLDCYNKLIPFIFDGFQKKLQTQIKKNYLKLLRFVLLRQFENDNWRATEDKEFINRFESVFSMKNNNSWEMIDEFDKLYEPYNENVRLIFDEIKVQLFNNSSVSGVSLFKKYLEPPYGLNGYVLLLIIVSTISIYKDNLKIYKKDDRIKIQFIIDELLNDKKFNIKNACEEFFSYIFIYSDFSYEKNEIEKIIPKVINSTNAKECIEYKKILDKYLSENDIDIELIEKYKMLKPKFNEAVEIVQYQLENIKDIKDKITQISNNFNLVNAVKLLNEINKSKEKISTSYGFFYDYEYINEINKLHNYIKNIINENALINIDKLNCHDIRQISEFRKAYMKCAEILKNNGFNEISKKLEDKIALVVSIADKKIKYEKIVADIDLFIALNEKNKLKTFKDMVNAIEEVQDKINLIEELDLKDIYSEKVDVLYKIKEGLIENINKINIEINQCKKEFDNIESIEKMKELKTKLNSLMDIGLPNNIVKELEEYYQKIIKFENYIELIKNNSLDRFYIEQTIKDMSCEFDEFKNIINKLEKDCFVKLDNMEEEWKNKYINKIENNLENLSAQECIKWINEINNIPTYISETTIKNIENLTIKINNRIKQCKLDSIIELFKELDDEDKQKCFNYLKELI